MPMQRHGSCRPTPRSPSWLANTPARTTPLRSNGCTKPLRSSRRSVFCSSHGAISKSARFCSSAARREPPIAAIVGARTARAAEAVPC
eukprot:5169857-Prymnesium_polylepis.3